MLLRPLDSEATLLSVVDRPVESEPIPVDVEVDSEAIELVAELRPVDVEVDSEATVLSGRWTATWTAKRRCYWWSTARWTTN
ncbi:chromosome segregation ATPase [Burkholderia pseudomallei]|nr:chromosome segregation ATPase [Burkholderia pseudomallei]